jgi:hypothetical protein
MTVDQEQGLYPPGTRVRVRHLALPYIARVIQDDPVNGRAKVRIETQPGLMLADAMTTTWVPYERITPL